MQLYVKVKHRRYKVDFDAMMCVHIRDGVLQTHKQKHWQRQRLCHRLGVSLAEHRSFGHFSNSACSARMLRSMKICVVAVLQQSSSACILTRDRLVCTAHSQRVQGTGCYTLAKLAIKSATSTHMTLLMLQSGHTPPCMKWACPEFSFQASCSLQKSALCCRMDCTLLYCSMSQ